MLKKTKFSSPDDLESESVWNYYVPLSARFNFDAKHRKGDLYRALIPGPGTSETVEVGQRLFWSCSTTAL